ncbi:MAG: Ig-like domain-containing protein [Anaerolineae bacterium]|nr:Ig-like domain-containing protein [Anaerolineae bacterium]
MDVCSRWGGLLSTLSLLVMTLACAIVPTPRSHPTVVITYPQSGSNVLLGREIVVQSVSATTDSRGIARVELWVDGQIVRVQTLNPPVSSYGASLPWTPDVLGTHVLEVRAYTLDNIASTPAQVYVNVVAEDGVVTPSVVPTPVASAAPATSAVLTVTAVAVDEVPNEPMVTALVGVNVRFGPGVEYAPPIGWLARGQSARITGRNAEGSWWQIEYPPGTVQRGWVSARPQYTTAYNAQDVPIVPVPPTPTPTSTPTDTPTPTLTLTPTSTPTATPNPLRPVIFSFTADHYIISPGESVTLRWDLMNAEAAYLRYNGSEEGVVAPGFKTVSPAATTTYMLVARNAFGTTTAEVTVVVREPSGPRVLFDFLSAAPAATWSNGHDLLPWSGAPDDPRGFVRWRDGEQLEDGSRPARVLAMYPERVPNGNILGLFPLPAPVRPGDRFVARVGFLAGAAGEVRFLVGIDGGSLSGFTLLAAQDDSTDGILKTIEADLSPVAGGQRIWLVVQAGSSAEQDHAVWVNPRIERQG